MGVTEKYENAEALLFPSVTMCPVVNVDDENLEAAVLNSNSAELWFNSTSDHSSKLALEGGDSIAVSQLRDQLATRRPFNSRQKELSAHFCDVIFVMII